MDTVLQRKRLDSLDVLRGFSMFWIMETERVIRELNHSIHSPVTELAANQLKHASWNGFTFYDLIFPLFIFVAGASTPYFIGRRLEKGMAKKKLLGQIVRRGLILILLGIVYNNGLEIRPLAEIRFPSVLGRIGIAYMLSSIIYLYANRRALFIWFGSLLIGYWGLLLTTAAPGFDNGDLSMNGNFVSYLDRLLIPGRLHKGIHDPEGLLSSIPAICTGLSGIYAGHLLRNSGWLKKRIAVRFVGVGVVFIVLALIWNLVFPINKNLWSSSFVLLTGGLSFLLLATFYYVIDILE